MIRTPLAATALLLCALPAAAQITADDVWANTQAYARALGARHTATLARTGAMVQISQDRVLWDLPMGFGTLGYALSDYTMTDNADGTVTITYPAPITATVDLQLTGGDGGFVTLTIGPDDIVTQAGGTPGAVSYTTITGPVRIALSDAVIPGDPLTTADFTFEVDRSETLTRIVEDTLTVIYTASDIGTAIIASRFAGPDGVVSDSTATYDPSRSEINMGLLPGGTSILNLSGALRDGMYLSAETTSDGSEQQSVTLIDGAVFTRSHISAGAGAVDIRFDRDGLMVNASGADLLFDMTYPEDLPGKTAFGLSGFANSLQIPLLASPGPQAFGYALDLTDLRLGPTIWALFDPDKALDRTPFQLNIDTGGTVINEIDWLDVLGLEGLRFENQFPAGLLDLTVSTLSLAGLGASFAGDAAFTFDMTDTVTYPGFPRPTGTAGFVLTGLNDVLTHLGDEGILQSDELFGFRMGLGMVTVPGGGADVQTGRIELTDDGQIIANGQRLR